MRHSFGGAPRGKSSQQKRKYCSITQYVQINNLELYTAMEDICPTLMGIFSMKSSGPNRPPKELTFLMPVPGSEMHKEIIARAYGGEELKAIDLIKTCLLFKHIANISDFKNGDSIRTAARSNVTVDTSGGFTKIGGAKIMTDDNFEMLYTDAKFHVYLLESGIPMTSVDTTQDHSVSGGAWASLREEQKSNSALRTPAGLAKSALATHLAKLKSTSSVSEEMPMWIRDSGASKVFSRWGVSLAKFCKDNNPELRGLIGQMFHPNPMCVIPFTALFVPEDTFKAWLAHEDPLNMSYDYQDYLQLCPKEPLVPESKVRDVITRSIQSVTSGPDRRPCSMGETAKIIQEGYMAACGSAWMKKLVYDEAIFIMNSYIRAAINKDWSKCESLSRIIVDCYSTRDSKVWLSAADQTAIKSGPMHCKLIEFTLSESFMYPNEYCKKNSRPAQVAETDADAMKYMSLPPQCVDFTGTIVDFFSKNA